jgi:S-(hydroxymethyl)glutathione dehydrogenase / alcohol dehydrogenase
MKAAVLREVGRPAAVDDLTLRQVAHREVMVQLAASGVCHTDLDPL